MYIGKYTHLRNDGYSFNSSNNSGFRLLCVNFLDSFVCNEHKKQKKGHGFDKRLETLSNSFMVAIQKYKKKICKVETSFPFHSQLHVSHQYCQSLLASQKFLTS